MSSRSQPGCPRSFPPTLDRTPRPCLSPPSPNLLETQLTLHLPRRPVLTNLRTILESNSGGPKGEQLFYKRVGAMVQLLEAHFADEDWIITAKRVSPALGCGNTYPRKLRVRSEATGKKSRGLSEEIPSVSCLKNPDDYKLAITSETAVRSFAAG